MAESLSRNSPQQKQPLSSAVSRAAALIAVFHKDVERFASLSAVSELEVPEPYAGLLAHQSHMTVAMERFHGGPVKLQVVAERSVLQGAADASYCREILLSKADGRIVQYGIVRIDLEPLPAASREAILCKEEPLGRILIASGMHRDVQAVEMLKVAPGRVFGQLMAATGSCYGRVAEIRLDGRPSVELLEVVPSFEG